jgi:hypothetical protein
MALVLCLVFLHLLRDIPVLIKMVQLDLVF